MDLKLNRLSEKEWELGYYHVTTMPGRTKRCFRRREKQEGIPPVRPLFVLLLEMVRSLKKTTWKDNDEQTALMFSALFEQHCAEEDIPLEAQLSTTADSVTPYVEQPKYQSTFYTQDPVEIIKNIIFERAPSKCRVVNRTIKRGANYSLWHLLQCPEKLEDRIAQALHGTSVQKTTRPKRGRRGGKKAKSWQAITL